MCGDGTTPPDHAHVAWRALTDVDLGIARGSASRGGDYQQNPGWMLAAGCHAGLQRIRVFRFIAHDDQGQHHALGRAPGAASDPHQFGGDLRRRGALKGDDHYGRLQLKPSRASMTSALLGPHDPGSYGSGCSGKLAQKSSTGSKISQESSTSSCCGNSGGPPKSTSKISRS